MIIVRKTIIKLITKIVLLFTIIKRFLRKLKITCSDNKLRLKYQIMKMVSYQENVKDDKKDLIIINYSSGRHLSRYLFSHFELNHNEITFVDLLNDSVV